MSGYRSGYSSSTAAGLLSPEFMAEAEEAVARVRRNYQQDLDEIKSLRDRNDELTKLVRQLTGLAERLGNENVALKSELDEIKSSPAYQRVKSTLATARSTGTYGGNQDRY